MSLARNLARLFPNASGLLPNANIEAMAASKLTGQVPDANAPSGSVIQVVQGSTTTIVSTTAYQTYVDTGLSATITPLLASSKILVIANQHYWQNSSVATTIFGHIRVLRDSTPIFVPSVSENVFGSSMAEIGYRQSMSIVDSPNTTSSITYKTQGYITAPPTGAQLTINRNNAIATIILMEIAA